MARFQKNPVPAAVLLSLPQITNCFERIVSQRGCTAHKNLFGAQDGGWGRFSGE
jgi:hypothetical protein